MKTSHLHSRKIMPTLFISCRMSHTEHDNEFNKGVQGNGQDAGTKFIKMKVVSQDNSEVQVKSTKVTDKFPEARTLPASEILSGMYHHDHLSLG